MKPKDIIEILDGMEENVDGFFYSHEKEALEEAVKYVERWIPKKVVRNGQWDPVICPTCNEQLSTHQGDGWYTDNDWMEYCPNEECHQKLDWA